MRKTFIQIQVTRVNVAYTMFQCHNITVSPHHHITDNQGPPSFAPPPSLPPSLPPSPSFPPSLSPLCPSPPSLPLSLPLFLPLFLPPSLLLLLSPLSLPSLPPSLPPSFPPSLPPSFPPSLPLSLPPQAGILSNLFLPVFTGSSLWRWASISIPYWPCSSWNSDAKTLLYFCYTMCSQSH